MFGARGLQTLQLAGMELTIQQPQLATIVVFVAGASCKSCIGRPKINLAIIAGDISEPLPKEHGL